VRGRAIWSKKGKSNEESLREGRGRERNESADASFGCLFSFWAGRLYDDVLVL
jgi:hypothetical protein